MIQSISESFNSNFQSVSFLKWEFLKPIIRSGYLQSNSNYFVNHVHAYNNNIIIIKMKYERILNQWLHR